MLWYDISIAFHYDVTTFASIFFFVLQKFQNYFNQNLKVRAYNGSNLVTRETQIESQKQI